MFPESLKVANTHHEGVTYPWRSLLREVTQFLWALGKKGIKHQNWALCSLGLMYCCSQFASLFQVLSLSPDSHFAPLQSANSFHSLQTKRFSKTRAFKVSDSDTCVPTEMQLSPHHSQGTSETAGAAPCLHPGREEVPLFFSVEDQRTEQEYVWDWHTRQ